MRAALVGGDVAGTKMVAGTPRRAAAHATAAPWLPPDAATTPAGGISRVRSALSAPRGLNEPVCWVCSNLRMIRPATPNSLPRTSRTGVRRTWPARRSAAACKSPVLGTSPDDEATLTGCHESEGRPSPGPELCRCPLPSRRTSATLEQVHLLAPDDGFVVRRHRFRPDPRTRPGSRCRARTRTTLVRVSTFCALASAATCGWAEYMRYAQGRAASMTSAVFRRRRCVARSRRETLTRPGRISLIRGHPASSAEHPEETHSRTRTLDGPHIQRFNLTWLSQWGLMVMTITVTRQRPTRAASVRRRT